MDVLEVGNLVEDGMNKGYIISTYDIDLLKKNIDGNFSIDPITNNIDNINDIRTINNSIEVM